uniref:Uncharacterized protein n=1 Tax=Solanum tuberosum TaxID=4113 RepID=M1D8D6_SOLTU
MGKGEATEFARFRVRMSELSPLKVGQLVGNPSGNFKGILVFSLAISLESTDRRSVHRSRPLESPKTHPLKSIVKLTGWTVDIFFGSVMFIVQLYSIMHAQYLSSTDAYSALHLLVM